MTTNLWEEIAEFLKSQYQKEPTELNYTIKCAIEMAEPFRMRDKFYGTESEKVTLKENNMSRTEQIKDQYCALVKNEDGGYCIDFMFDGGNKIKDYADVEKWLRENTVSSDIVYICKMVKAIKIGSQEV